MKRIGIDEIGLIARLVMLALMMSVAVAACCLSGCSVELEAHIQSVPVEAPSTSPMVREVNRARIARRLPPLAEDPRLSESAAWWARRMAANRVLTHGTPAQYRERLGRVYPGRANAENIAYGQRDIKAVVDVWMASPGHEANLMGDYTIVGMGVAKDRFGVPYYCCQMVR